MMKHIKRSLVIFTLAGAQVALPSLANEPPRLVLQITVDGLRADLLQRYRDNFTDGGFRYLLENGTVYRNAHYQHANTETIVGHATLATGATPSVHGMVGNVWYHSDSGQLGYNIEDPKAPLLPTRDAAARGAQVDPAQLRASSSGRSPRAILVPTFSDSLVLATGGKGKNFGISGKDRGAVALAGQSGIAYWYSTDTGDFQSSTYYMDSYPVWVNEWNNERQAESLSGDKWQLLEDKEDYLHADRDDRPYEVDLKGYGRTFPHAFGDKTHPLFFTRVLVSPWGDKLLADFGKKLIQEENLGQDNVPDFLSVSFSGVDAVNHFFGPSSLENEDVVLQLDRTLEELFEFVDDQVGLEHTVIVLSADHGMADMPEYATELGLDAGRLYSDEVLELANSVAKNAFGRDDLVKDFFRPYVYLDPTAMKNAQLEPSSVAAVIATGLESNPGIFGAVTREESNGLGGSLTGADASVRANHHATRSGDIYVYQSPYWFLFDRGAVAAMHGSPWAYDQHVPIIFVGKSIERQLVDRLIHPVDVAPTLSALLGIHAPAASEGQVLAEVIIQQ